MTNLLEEILNEDSTITSAVRSSPYADALIRAVHKELAMPHDLEWKEEQKITWADIKSRSPNYVLIQGIDGTGAIKWNGSQWVVVLSSKEGVSTLRDGSINILFTEIKERIGKIRSYWSATNSGVRSYGSKVATNPTGPVEKKRSQRQDARRITSPDSLDPNAGHEHNLQVVIYKLRPLYARYIEQAMADIKGVIGIQLKNNAFSKVKSKLEILDNLERTLEELRDNPKKIPSKLKEKLRPALYMTASHFYPDETGNFNLGGGYRGRSPERSAGQRRVISDIANGDQEKLTTLMNFLKQSLLHP
jgi:hypothetical protein